MPLAVRCYRALYERLADYGWKPHGICMAQEKPICGPQFTGVRINNRGVQFHRIGDFKKYNLNSIPPNGVRTNGVVAEYMYSSVPLSCSIMHLCIYRYIHTHVTRTCTYICVILLCNNAHMCICSTHHVCTYIYIYTYIHTYIHNMYNMQ